MMQYYADARRQWNEAPHPKTGLPRLEMYRSSTNPDCKEVEIWDMVNLFWIERPKPVTIDAYGISFKENKIQYDYMVEDKNGLPDLKWLRNNIGRKVYIKYDPEEMDLIFLYEKEALGLRFLCEAKPKVVVSRGLQEQQDGDLSFIHQVNHIEKIVRIEARDEMEEILETHGHHPNQHGLNSPHLKGIERKAKDSFGKMQKEQSEAVLVEVKDEHFLNQFLPK